MLFLAYGYTELDEVCDMIAKTAVWEVSVIKDLLYVTLQHTAAVRTQAEAIQVLSQYMMSGPATGSNTRSSNASSTPGAVEDLLHANVLPHLALPEAKMQYLAHMVGVLLNHIFDPRSRESMLYDIHVPLFFNGVCG